MNRDPIPSSFEAKDIQFQCSQALHTLNTNVTSCQIINPKPKKMSSNKRRRQKLKRQQSRQALHEIIKNMCSLKTTFQQNIKTIEVLLEVDLDEDRFYEFISRVTRQEMDILAKQIHSLTAYFCLLYREHKAIDPIEVAKFFQWMSIVRQASIQIQKVINYFILKSQQGDVEGYMHRNLEYSTLKYIVQSDPMKEDFENFCNTFIRQSKDKRQIMIIEQIMNRFKKALQFKQEPDQCLECCQQLQVKHQTYESKRQLTIDQQFQLQQVQQLETLNTQASQQNKKKKKKKKNKNKQQQKVFSICKQIQMYNNVINYLSQLEIQENSRLTCYVDQSWLYKLKSKIDKQKWMGSKSKS